jgi:hypothetical protein
VFDDVPQEFEGPLSKDRFLRGTVPTVGAEGTEDLSQVSGVVFERVGVDDYVVLVYGRAPPQRSVGLQWGLDGRLEVGGRVAQPHRGHAKGK